jgi:hypothetical protein
MSFSYLVDNGTKWRALPVFSVVADGVHLLRWVGEKAGMTQQVLDGPRDGSASGKVALRRRQRQSSTRKASRAAETVGPLPAAGTTRKIIWCLRLCRAERTCPGERRRECRGVITAA